MASMPGPQSCACASLNFHALKNRGYTKSAQQHSDVEVGVVTRHSVRMTCLRCSIFHQSLMLSCWAVSVSLVYAQLAVLLPAAASVGKNHISGALGRKVALICTLNPKPQTLASQC